MWFKNVCNHYSPPQNITSPAMASFPTKTQCLKTGCWNFFPYLDPSLPSCTPGVCYLVSVSLGFLMCKNGTMYLQHDRKNTWSAYTERVAVSGTWSTVNKWQLLPSYSWLLRSLISSYLMRPANPQLFYHSLPFPPSLSDQILQPSICRPPTRSCPLPNRVSHSNQVSPWVFNRSQAYSQLLFSTFPGPTENQTSLLYTKSYPFFQVKIKIPTPQTLD